jgi:outer membrane protein TolC
MKRKIGIPVLLPLAFGCLVLAAGCMTTRIADNTPAAWRAAMQPALDEPVARGLAVSPSLNQVVRLAVERNAGVEAQRQQWRGMIETEPQALSLPDPSLYELNYNFTMDRWESVQIMQEIPWPQKIWTGGKIAATEADLARLQYEIALRDLIVEVKNTWYELAYLDRATSVTAQIETLFRNQSQLAYQQQGTGQTQLNEAFRAESQSAQLAYDRVLLSEQRATQVERLKALLNLPPETVIGPVRHAPVYAVEERVDPLYRRAEQYAQILRVRGLEAQKARYQTFLAKLSRLPDFSPSFMVEGLSGSVANSYAGMITATLPIWEYRNRALIREKQAAEEAMKRSAMEETNQVRRSVAQAYFQVALSRRLVDLYGHTLLPQAESVMRQTEIDFRAGVVPFSSVLETTLAWHNFLLAHSRAQADLGQAIGRLEQVLGTTAEPRPEDGGEVRP